MMSVLVKPVPGGVGNIPLRMSPTDSSFQNVNSIDKLVDFDLNTTLVLKPSQQLWAQSPAAAVVSVTQVFV